MTLGQWKKWWLDQITVPPVGAAEENHRSTEEPT